MAKFLGVLLLGWAIAFFGSFAVFWLTPARDFGFTAGMNKFTMFMGWQAAATVLALACLGIRWSTSEPRLRRIAAIPAVSIGLMLSVLAVVLFWSRLQQPPPNAAPPDPKPVTEPIGPTDG